MALGGCRGDLQGLGSLLDGEPTEVAQLDQLRTRRIDRRQTLQGRVQRHQVQIHGGLHQLQLGQRNALSTVTLARAMAPRVVHQDLAHQPRSHAYEVHPVLPVDPVHPRQAHVGLIDQRGRLQGVITPLIGKLPPCDRPQLGIRHAHQTITRSLVTRAPGRQQRCELMGRGHATGV